MAFIFSIGQERGHYIFVHDDEVFRRPSALIWQYDTLMFTADDIMQ
jgi:hypothetical protein